MATLSMYLYFEKMNRGRPNIWFYWLHLKSILGGDLTQGLHIRMKVELGSYKQLIYILALSVFKFLLRKPNFWQAVLQI